MNPDTARIMGMPGGSDYLAGIGPPPKGLSAADMVAPAPVIHPVAGGFGTGGPINSNISQWIRTNYPHGFGHDWQNAMFSIYNATGYKPTNPGQQAFYNNGVWGPIGGAPYNPGGAGNVAAPSTPLQANIAATTQTQFAPTGSTNPNMNSALMQYNPAQASKPLPFTLNSNSNYDAMRNAAATAPGASGLGYPPFQWPKP